MNWAVRALIIVVAAAAIFGAGYLIANRSHDTSTTSTSSTTSSTSSTSSTTLISACAGTQFSGVLQATQGTAGTVYSGMTLTNNGAVACTVSGWPLLRYFDASNQALTTTIVRSATYFSGVGGVPIAPAAFTIAPQGTVQFKIAFSDVPVGSQTSCNTVDHVNVFLPLAQLSTDAIVVSVAGKGYAPCGPGLTYVSPYYS